MKPHVEVVRAALSAAARVNPDAASALEGRRIALEVPGERLVVAFAGGAIAVSSDPDVACDATLRGSLAGVLAHLAGREGAAAMGDEAVVAGFLDLVRPGLPSTAPDVRALGEDVGDAVRLGVRAAQSVLQTMAGVPPQGGEEPETLEARVADLERRVRRLERSGTDGTDEESPPPEQ